MLCSDSVFFCLCHVGLWTRTSSYSCSGNSDLQALLLTLTFVQLAWYWLAVRHADANAETHSVWRSVVVGRNLQKWSKQIPESYDNLLAIVKNKIILLLHAVISHNANTLISNHKIKQQICMVWKSQTHPTQSSVCMSWSAVMNLMRSFSHDTWYLEKLSVCFLEITW